jgi:DeoR family transcriptional regulator of aga operon/DeoR family fructose operon transcriptional repressor
MSEERRRQILDLIERKGSVRVDDLASRFSVSHVTIRKDLTDLEERGLLQRTHGGALPAFKSRFNLSFLEKEQLNAAQKSSIARAAASLIDEGDAIILDGGSTTLALAREIKSTFKHLVVITCSIPIALELSHTSWDVILVGGSVRQHSLALIGPAAISTLREYHADKTFVGATGVTIADGYSTPNPNDAALKRAMMRAANKTYVLTDSSKLGHAALVNFARLDEVATLITDAAAPQDFLREMQARGAAFVIAPQST